MKRSGLLQKRDALTQERLDVMQRTMKRKKKSRKKNGPYTEPTRCIHAMSTALDWTARI